MKNNKIWIVSVILLLLFSVVGCSDDGQGQGKYSVSGIVLD
ncbi:hypothetical protein [Halanaerobacter jeridensis]|uniref:ABC-type Fe3+-citrate transport system substrate-binding protein n=1 Tax=Halanaerobacter jeridensis TaxID=706427 RepID=A0A939BS48_9FIRM|nr:hypothetical protein [Halanaerobacter jeridensis]MBM7556746.1 ABC-type Fe3+-citrate transport system substrate-binding protein [Halanaerobacter jeridensis]